MSRPLYSPQALPFILAFLESGGKDYTQLAVFADWLEERGDEFAQYIRLALRPSHPRSTDFYDQGSSLLGAARDNISPRVFVRFFTQGDDNFCLLANFTLNEGASGISNSRRERAMYWHVPIPAGQSIYRLLYEELTCQVVTRTRGNPKKALGVSSMPAQDEFSWADFRPASFSQMPQSIVLYSFIIACNRAWWTHAGQEK